MNTNREKYKRILVIFSSFIITFIFMLAFSYTWKMSYNNILREAFFYKGNLLLVLIYTCLYVVVTKNIKGFKVSYLRTLSLFGSQILGVVITNFIAFILISLIGHGRLSIMPIVNLTVFELLVSFLWSLTFTKFFKMLYPPRNIIIIYGNPNSIDLIRKMNKRDDRFNIKTALSCDEDIEKIKEQMLCHEAVIISDVPSALRNKILKFTLDKSIRVYMTPKLSDIIIRSSENFDLFDTPLLLSRNEGLSFEQKFTKRFADLMLSVFLLIVSSPFMLFTALAIKLYDRGPVLYSQKRLTIDGKVFNIYKFRSMIVNAEGKNEVKLAQRNDKRVTPIGKFIRKVRLDELPQLFNILKGDMSFIGPRPERPEFSSKYEKTMPEFRYRLKVKAGLTGFAQVMGKYNTTAYDKLKLDLMYIQNQSFLLDLKILLLTIKTCFIPEATEGVTTNQAVETKRYSHPQRDEDELDNILK